MDNWSALFDGQTRYFLDINDSSVKPDVLRFYGREALSEPFSWDIEFTTLQANIPPEEVLMKYASFRMRSGKSVHGMGPDFEFRLERTYPPREIITQWRETDLEFIWRILSEVGIYWRTMMDDVRGLDTYIFADSQLNYQFDVRLPYREPSGLFDGAAESVWGLPYTERYCFRLAEILRPEIHGTLPARGESREKNDIYAHRDEQGRYRVKLDFDREGTEPGYGYLWLRMAKPYAGETLGWHTPLIDGTEVAIAYSNGDIDLPYRMLTAS
ncbi:VgrG protein [Klebsiella michiganensis]